MKTFIFLLSLFFLSCQTNDTDYKKLLKYYSKTNIKLPKAIGKLIEFEDNVIYHFFYLDKIHNDSLALWYNGKQINLSDFSIEYRENLYEDYSVLFIDKDLKMKQVVEFFDIINGYLLNRIIIAVTNEDKYELHGINVLLPNIDTFLFEPKTVPIVTPEYNPFCDATNYNTFVYRNDSIFLNEILINEEILKKAYIQKLNSNKRTSFYIYVDSTSNFQSYIYMLDLFYYVIEVEREKLSKMKFNLRLKDLNDIQYNQIREIMPLQISRLSDKEYENLLILNCIEFNDKLSIIENVSLILDYCYY